MGKEDEKKENEGQDSNEPESNEVEADPDNAEDGVTEEPKVDTAGAVEEAKEAKEDDVQGSSLAAPNQEIKQSSGEEAVVKENKEENAEKSGNKVLIGAAKTPSKHHHMPHPHMPHMTRQQKEDFRKFLWNKEKKAFLGRNAKSWGKHWCYMQIHVLVM